MGEQARLCPALSLREIYAQHVVFVLNSLTFVEVRISFFGAFSTPVTVKDGLLARHFVPPSSHVFFYLHRLLLRHPPICFTL